MPNYGLQINSQFQPFTMDELLRPVMSATQSYRETEDAYGKLKTEAEQLRYISNILRDINTNESLAAANKYDDYYNQLEESAKELSETGKITNSRRALWDITGSYARDILPMKTGYEALSKQMEEQAKNPNIAYKKRYSLEDLPGFIGDPSGMNLGENQMIDKNYLLKVSADSYSTLAKRLNDYYKNPKGKINEVTDMLVTDYGVNPNEVQAFLKNPSQNNILGAVYNNMIKSFGIDSSWADFEELNNTIALGAMSAIGEQKTQPITDQEALLRARAALAGRNGKGKQPVMNPLQSRDLYIMEKTEFAKNNPKYFTRDTSGKLKVNKNKVEAILSKYDKYTQEEIDFIKNYKTASSHTDEEIKKAIDILDKMTNSKSGLYDFTGIQSLQNDIQEAEDMIRYLGIEGEYRSTSPITTKYGFQTVPITHYTIDYDKIEEEFNKNPATAEAILHKTPEFYYKPKEGDETDIKDALVGALASGDNFKIVSRRTDKDFNVTYADTGKYLRKGDLKDYNIIDIGFSQGNCVVNLQKGNDTISIRIPEGKLTGRMVSLFEDMGVVSKAYQETFADEKAGKLTSKDAANIRLALNQKYMGYADSMGQYFSDWYRPNTAVPYRRKSGDFGTLNLDQLYQLADESGMSIEEVLEELNNE